MSNLIIFLRIKNPIQDSFKMIGIFAIVSLPKKNNSANWVTPLKKQ